MQVFLSKFTHTPSGSWTRTSPSTLLKRGDAVWAKAHQQDLIRLYYYFDQNLATLLKRGDAIWAKAHWQDLIHLYYYFAGDTLNDSLVITIVNISSLSIKWSIESCLMVCHMSACCILNLAQIKFIKPNNLAF